MNNQNINEHEELLEMREQHSILRQKVQSQEIINEKMIFNSVQKSVKSINLRGIFYTLFSVAAVPYCYWGFHKIGCSQGFLIGTGILLAFCAILTGYIHYGLYKLDVTQGNLLQVGKKAMQLRRRYVRWTLWSIPLVLVWLFFLYREIVVIEPDRCMQIGMLITVLVALVIGAVISFWVYMKMLRSIDKLLLHIEELENTEN